MLATHFPKLTELETKTDRFKNYQVTILFDANGHPLEDANGKVIRTFKLEEDRSFVNIAMDLLQEGLLQ